MKRALLPSLTAALIALALCSTACKKKSMEGMLQAADEKASICVYNGLAVRATATKGGKYLASLSLGETAKWTGDKNKDEAGKEYLKVTLSDGQEGWALAAGLVTGAKVGALGDDTVLYKRPDPLTATPQKVPCMSIVAITLEKDGWVQLTGEGRRALGWVPIAAVVVDKTEVTTAILATKKLREKDGLDRAAKVEAIAAMVPNPASPFIQRLRDRATEPAPVPLPDGGDATPKGQVQ